MAQRKRKALPSVDSEYKSLVAELNRLRRTYGSDAFQFAFEIGPLLHWMDDEKLKKYVEEFKKRIGESVPEGFKWVDIVDTSHLPVIIGVAVPTSHVEGSDPKDFPLVQWTIDRIKNLVEEAKQDKRSSCLISLPRRFERAVLEGSIPQGVKQWIVVPDDEEEEWFLYVRW